MRAAASLLLVLSLGVVGGCRFPPGSDPYPVDKDVRVMASAGRSFVLHIEGTDGCRAQLAIGTVRRATLDSIYFSVLKQVDAKTLGDVSCVTGRAGVMVFREAERKPSVARYGPGSQNAGLLLIAAVLIGLLSFSMS